MRIKRGLVGEGHRFTVTELSRDGFGKPVAYGHGYGPRWLDELEAVIRAT